MSLSAIIRTSTMRHDWPGRYGRSVSLFSTWGSGWRWTEFPGHGFASPQVCRHSYWGGFVSKLRLARTFSRDYPLLCPAIITKSGAELGRVSLNTDIEYEYKPRVPQPRRMLRRYQCALGRGTKRLRSRRWLAFGQQPSHLVGPQLGTHGTFCSALAGC